MIDSASLFKGLTEEGYDFFSSVPCSTFKVPLAAMATDPSIDHIAATSEGEAVALAAGGWLAGRQPAIFMQNSGFGNAMNPIASLTSPYQIPVLMFCSWRGEPGTGDAPQHAIMGDGLQNLLDVLGLEHGVLGASEVVHAISRAAETARRHRLGHALVVPKGSITGDMPRIPQPDEKMSHGGRPISFLNGTPIRPTRFSVLERLLENIPEEAACVSTTGRCSRELFAIENSARHFYQAGSMGYASAIGLGVATCRPKRSAPVVVLDGDGAALMHMGNFASIGAQKPENLIHILLNNFAHDTTGGQSNASSNVNYPKLALACGYETGIVCDNLDALEAVLKQAMASPGPAFIEVRIARGAKDGVGRPHIPLAELAGRFRARLLAETGPAQTPGLLDQVPGKEPVTA